MGLSSSDEIVVLRLQPRGLGWEVTLHGDPEPATFGMWFEDARGIRVLADRGGLARWLTAQGKLWGGPVLYALLERASAGHMPTLPCRLAPAPVPEELG